jgi:uncharacterized protein YndB with AHSA1/START domain
VSDERSEPTAHDRAIELEVVVDGTPEEVWEAIATGPGISSWYVPHEVEERKGGRASASFGEGPEMQIPGVVAAWEPPHRVVFTGEEGSQTLAFEWLVEARDGGSCVVRLVNTGFGTGDDWDAQYDGMREGWQLFLTNLQLHMRHFRGRHARAMLPMSMWTGDRAAVWARLLERLGLPAEPAAGEHVHTSGDAPALGGAVLASSSWRLALLVDDPAPGTAFIAAEGAGEHVGVSVWSYLYGDERDAVVASDLPRWNAWLAANAEG